ncbi:MAG: hypothetical protein HXY41_01515 [Chloroflexi bacterium]|nr:hypothetical protein [Chloroflexota bacterium]
MAKKWMIGVVFAAALALAGLAAFRPATAQGSPANLRALLERLNAGGTAFTVQFAAPVAAGETLLALPDESRRLADIGEDYLCFSQPWNDTLRMYCTPFSNVVGITYTTP